MALNETQGVEVGFDESFERKWIRFEHITWALMLAVVILGLAGGFGRGPLVHAHAAAAPIQVEFERIVRYQTDTQITVTSAAENGIQRLFVGRALLDRLQLQTVVPQPAGAEPRGDGAVLLFPRTKGSSQVTLVASPAELGTARNVVGLPEGPRVTFSQFVLP
jgi:hypothetical protein